MRTRLFSKLLLSVIVFFCCLFVACTKKSPTSRCEPIGGVSIPNHVLFWINYNWQGTKITVQLKDADGNIVNTFYKTISVYYSAGQPADCDQANCARFDMHYGTDYTYTATSDNGLSWSGNVASPCAQDQCQLIQLK